MTTFFKRFEKKYIIDSTQYEMLAYLTEGKLVRDERSSYALRNLYYDTDNYDLIRASIQKPTYKEKLRLRMYEAPGASAEAFIELKKKVDGIVYKRRLKTNLLDAISILEGGYKPIVKPEDINTLMEIEHFLGNYAVTPKAFIRYDRSCLKGVSDPEFRMTFDTNIIYQNADPNLPYGSKMYENRMDKGILPVIEPDQMIMEIKTPTAIPVWLSKIMSELDIYPTSFSKYGVAYQAYVGNQLFNGSNPLTSGGKTEDKKEMGVSLSA